MFDSGCRDQPVIDIGHDLFFDIENLDVEAGLELASQEPFPSGERRLLRPAVLPAVTTITAVQAGGIEQEHRRSHHAIGRWLRSHSRHLTGPIREILHGADGDITVEVQYPMGAKTAPLCIKFQPADPPSTLGEGSLVIVQNRAEYESTDQAGTHDVKNSDVDYKACDQDA